MEYQIENIFMEQSCRKYAGKATSRPLYNFDNPKQPLHARKFFKSKIF